MPISVSKAAYAGWPNCYRISDGTVEAVVTADVGPRVIRCGFVGGPNLFGEMAEQLGVVGGDEWRIYGGHRLWHSPETKSRCYHPDNFPVAVEVLADGVALRQAVEPNTGIEKEIVLTLDGSEHRFTVEHRLTNRGNWPVTFAPWALSVMKQGGVAIVPQYREPDEEGLLPSQYITLWPYSDMMDSRVKWGHRYILLRQDPSISNPFKFGLSVVDGWAAYSVDGFLFMKQFEYDPCAEYPDNGMNAEVYTNDRFIEVESLGPLCEVYPGDTASHVETWSLFQGVSQIKDESDVDDMVVPLLKR